MCVWGGWGVGIMAEENDLWIFTIWWDLNAQKTNKMQEDPLLKAMSPQSECSVCPLVGLGEWWSTSWAQHHGTEHFNPESPKAYRLSAPDQSTVHPSLYILQKGVIIIYLHNCNKLNCMLYICWERRNIISTVKVFLSSLHLCHFVKLEKLALFYESIVI